MGTSTEQFLPRSDNHNSLAPRQRRTILQSWKEIASELDRGVRTVQRWERTLGLPVHRLGKGARGPVFAFKDELHLWFQKKAGVSDLEATQSSPGKRFADSRSKHSFSGRNGHSRTKRSFRKEGAMSGTTLIAKARVLQAIKDLFALEGSRQRQQDCRHCHSALRFLEGRFYLYGTDMEMRVPIPYCPSCEEQIAREFCHFSTVH